MGALHPNLVAEYRLDGNGNDTSGNGLTLTNNGVTFTAGLGSQVGVFDDTEPGDTLSRTNFTPTAQMTFTAWIKRSSVGEQGYVFALDNPVSARRYNLALTANQQYLAVYDLGILRDGAAASNFTDWTHVAVVFNGTAIAFYVSGAAAGTRSYDDTVNLSPATLTIGGRTGTYSVNAWFNGNIARMRIYNAALSITDIKRDMLGLHPVLKT